jgi:hypothetical protein
MAWAIAAVATLAVVFLVLNRRAAAAVLGLALVLGGVLWLVTEQDLLRRSEERQAVTARAAIDASACADPGQPILVEFHNGTGRVVERVSFELTARLKGHSSISYRAFLRSDRIIEPGEAAIVCYGILPHGFAAPRPVNPDLTTYDWEAGITLVNFGG